MKATRPHLRQLGFITGALSVLFSVAFPGLAFADAGQVTTRSIQMSSSAVSATSVSYELKGTIPHALNSGGGLVVQFCDGASGPLVGQACTAPSGLSTSGVGLGAGSSPSGTASPIISNTAIKWVDSAAVSASTNLDITFTGITNPSDLGTFYARITTYADAPDYVSATSVGTVLDEGGIALSTTENIGITAYVRESLTFCVADAVLDKDCGNAASNPPSMTLGEVISGGQKALDPSAVSTGTDYAQVSTNASAGAVVNLHTSTTGCGGLIRAGATNCDIGPQDVTANSITAGQALFGVEVGPAAAATTGSGSTPSGTLAATNNYSSSKYFMDYVTGDASGVTGPYGSAIFNSAGDPVSNQNMPLQFGVSAANDTPAGIYSATLNLIATGTF